MARLILIQVEIPGHRHIKTLRIIASTNFPRIRVGFLTCRLVLSPAQVSLCDHRPFAIPFTFVYSIGKAVMVMHRFDQLEKNFIQESVLRAVSNEKLISRRTLFGEGSLSAKCDKKLHPFQLHLNLCHIQLASLCPVTACSLPASKARFVSFPQTCAHSNWPLERYFSTGNIHKIRQFPDLFLLNAPQRS
uniref:AlNc14C250G9634 protein n=1 Tax=Albugo laibachii Nc14 TaxID=890382 RepID=F0WTF5_9STRA|nr:AlNc14C250G9634 [Albugo laibachii Nc14]|eukprot:CCA24645.1 AlNc14C250G9634 [Albugo laibachii Nc14]